MKALLVIVEQLVTTLNNNKKMDVRDFWHFGNTYLGQSITLTILFGMRENRVAEDRVGFFIGFKG